MKEVLLRPDTIDRQELFDFIFQQNVSDDDKKLGDWWNDFFPEVPMPEHPKLRNTMLYLIAYDITLPKRLSKVAKTCEDFGVRVQYSLFECRLKPDHFEVLWTRLNEIIDHETDRIVAYQLDTDNAARTLTAGTMEVTTPVVCYLV